MANYKDLVPFILSWEGGFANIPQDRGGATNKGVTIATFRSVFGKDKSVADLKAMTDEQWMHIFKLHFWNRWQADQILDQNIANTCVDWVWASGQHGITRVQKLLGVKADGIVGPVTLAALNAKEPRAFFEAIQADRRVFVNNIVKRSPSQKIFLRGWLRRINSIQYGKLICNH